MDPLQEIMERCKRNMEQYKRDDAWRADVDARIAASEAVAERFRANAVREPAKPTKRYRSTDDGQNFEL